MKDIMAIKNCPWRKENIKEGQELWHEELYNIIIQRQLGT
jgi:hypothetical protein